MVVTSALVLISLALHDAHAGSRSAWRQHGGDEPYGYISASSNLVLLHGDYRYPDYDVVVDPGDVYPNWVDNGAAGRGPLYLIEQYSAGIPAESDAGWTTAGTNPVADDPDALYWYTTSTIPNRTWWYDYANGWAIPFCSNVGDFTYVDTTVYIPEGAALSSASVNYGYVDDGVVITVYNSGWPEGVQVDSTHRQYGRLGAGDASYFDHTSGDIASYLVAGECNRIVISAVDTCAGVSGLGAAVVYLDDAAVLEGTDADVDGVLDACVATADTDGDGSDDDVDNCPDDANAGQADLDGDGLGDACDGDVDGDSDPGGSDCDDLDPSVFAGATEVCDDGVDNDCDGDTDLDDDDVDLDDPASDCDGDGAVYADDDCVYDYNPGQDDLDGDLDGDVCDLDDDGDGVPDADDNCPAAANADQADADGDGAGDECDADADGDGLDDATDDWCPGTSADAPTKGLGNGRWADLDADGVFDTVGRNASRRSYTVEDTMGCSCDQVIEICGYGDGHVKFGCSNSVMDTWTGLFDKAGGAPGSCE